MLPSIKILRSSNDLHKNLMGNFQLPKDFQLPIGPTLSRGTLQEVYLVVLIYIPSITLFLFSLGLLIFHLRVPILALTSMLPSIIQYHTGRFIGAIERCELFHPLPFTMAILIQMSKSPKDVL
jgi:hypothetical protein